MAPCGDFCCWNSFFHRKLIWMNREESHMIVVPSNPLMNSFGGFWSFSSLSNLVSTFSDKQPPPFYKSFYWARLYLISLDSVNKMIYIIFKAVLAVWKNIVLIKDAYVLDINFFLLNRNFKQHVNFKFLNHFINSPYSCFEDVKTIEHVQPSFPKTAKNSGPLGLIKLYQCQNRFAVRCGFYALSSGKVLHDFFTKPSFTKSLC